MSEIIAALIGVLIGGGFNAINALFERYRQAKAIAFAIRAEISALITVANYRNYLGYMKEAYASQEAGPNNGVCTFKAVMSQNYFIVFENNTGQIGLLDRALAEKVVLFYTQAKAFSEDMQIGTYTKDGLKEALDLLEFTSSLGNEIVSLIGEIYEKPIHHLILNSYKS